MSKKEKLMKPIIYLRLGNEPEKEEKKKIVIDNKGFQKYKGKNIER